NLCWLVKKLIIKGERYLMLRDLLLRVLLLVTILFSFNSSPADAVTYYSPAYRAKTTIGQNGEGYSAMTVTLVLPGNSDIKGNEKTGAAYNYLGMETENSNSLEIGLHKDTFDRNNQQWSVFAFANYNGVFSLYGSYEKWHNFRSNIYMQQVWPTLVVPDGSTVTMSLEVIKPDEVVFTIEGQEPVTLKMPGANPQGQKQILRRVTSLMTEDPTGFLHNNVWSKVQVKGNDGILSQWIPQEIEKTVSNNMDEGDPMSNWVNVTTGQYYPETINIKLDAPTNQGAFQVGNRFYYINGSMEQADVAPFIEGGRTYVPVRYLSHICGITEGEIVWDENSQSVSLSHGGILQVLRIGKKEQLVNGISYPMDVSPLIVNDRICLPARYVANQFGYTVEWDNAHKTVYIYPKGQACPDNPYVQ
ncbi:MAG: copper amine oxidase N-terminal domain-containing protein, partial [Clostridia bacterium]|nr:copper amine oxidase N-terminal domain-containing protein [Clostridia bacterium]